MKSFQLAILQQQNIDKDYEHEDTYEGQSIPICSLNSKGPSGGTKLNIPSTLVTDRQVRWAYTPKAMV